MNRFIIFVFLLAILFFSSACSNQVDTTNTKYYVSTNGNDANSGNSDAPFRTIKKGVSVLSAGDTLIVKSGNYGYEYDINI